MPEWSIGAVSKTVVPFGTQGSNPCLSASDKNQFTLYPGVNCFFCMITLPCLRRLILKRRQ